MVCSDMNICRSHNINTAFIAKIHFIAWRNDIGMSNFGGRNWTVNEHRLGFEIWILYVLLSFVHADDLCPVGHKDRKSDLKVNIHKVCALSVHFRNFCVCVRALGPRMRKDLEEILVSCYSQKTSTPKTGCQKVAV